MTSSDEGQACKLFDLHDDIFVVIRTFAAPADFLNLTFASRKTHLYLFGLFLKQFKIKVSDDMSTIEHLRIPDSIEDTRVLVHAVWRSPLVKKVKKLSCLFCLPETRLLWQVRALYQVARKIESVHTIMLNFALVPHELKFTPTMKLMKPIEEWRRAFDILTLAMLDKGPSVVDIFDYIAFEAPTTCPHGHPITAHGHGTTSPTTISSRIRRLLSRVVPRIHYHKPCLSPTSETVQSFLQSPGLKSITSLSLRQAIISPEHWKLLSESVSLPSLQRLTVHPTTTETFTSLCKFLCKHPAITSLCLRGSDTATDRRYPLQHPFLPDLERLVAPLSIMSAFYQLQEQKQGRDTPAMLFPKVKVHSICLEIYRATELLPTIDELSTFIRTKLQGRPASVDMNIHRPHWLPDPPFEFTIPSVIQICVLDLDGSLEADSPALVPWLARFIDVTKVVVIHLTAEPRKAIQEAFAKQVFDNCKNAKEILVRTKVYTPSDFGIVREGEVTGIADQA